MVLDTGVLRGLVYCVIASDVMLNIVGKVFIGSVVDGSS